MWLNWVVTGLGSNSGLQVSNKTLGAFVVKFTSVTPVPAMLRVVTRTPKRNRGIDPHLMLNHLWSFSQMLPCS
eukprot:1158184-Pelagomonas_calceolata.AAC.4